VVEKRKSITEMLFLGLIKDKTIFQKIIWHLSFRSLHIASNTELRYFIPIAKLTQFTYSNYKLLFYLYERY